MLITFPIPLEEVIALMGRVASILLEFAVAGLGPPSHGRVRETYSRWDGLAL